MLLLHSNNFVVSLKHQIKTNRIMEENKKPKNPRAFPGSSMRDHLGMTLRDYFAAKAMQSCISLLSPTDIHTEGNQIWVSEIGYKVADAMLKQREI